METPPLLESFLIANPLVTFVRFQWLDLSGILRCRFCTREYCTNVASARKPLSLAPLAMTSRFDGSTLDTYEASGTNRLWPDWKSLRMSNFKTSDDNEKRYGSVMCSLTESTPLQPNMGSKRCPRTLLYHVLWEAESKHGLTFLVGFETEFIIANRDGEGNIHHGHVNAGKDAVAGCQVPNFRYVEESVRDLQGLGVKVEQFHPEGYHGQYEISMGPLPPMAAVDTLINVRDAIKNVCAKHDVLAVMHPKPFSSHPSSAAHTHFSLEPGTQEENFIAGILKRLPGLCAFSMANFDSYERRAEAGQWVSWGTQSRDVPLRKVSAGHWEIRNVDATANAYLFLAAYLAAGLLGIRNSERLVWKDSTGWSSEYTFEQREALNIDTTIPVSLMEAVERLRGDCDGLADILGQDIITQYAYLKQRECELVAGWDAEKRIRLFSEFF